MPLSFPSSPSVNQQATLNGRTYRWTGSVWEFVSSGGGGSSGLTWSSVPASATASGTAGQIAYDGSYYYVCTAANTWKRTGLTTWSFVNDLPGICVWLDAADASTLYNATSGGSRVSSGGSVARWADKSGLGNDFTQGNGSYQPIYDGTGLILAQNSGRHLVRDMTQTNNVMSFFAVVVVNGRGGSRHQYGRFLSASNGDNADYADNSGILLSDFPTPSLQVYRNSAPIASATAATIGQRLVVGFVMDGTNVTLYRNTATSSGTTSGTALNVTRMRLGNNAAPTTDSSLWGGFYEVVMTSTALNATQANGLVSYLMTKWGIA